MTTMKDSRMKSKVDPAENVMLMLKSIWFARESSAHHLPGVSTVNKKCSAVLRGVSHEYRFVGGGARNQEPDGDTRRRDNDLDRLRPSDRRNT